jgi:hypothetical protein
VACVYWINWFSEVENLKNRHSTVEEKYMKRYTSVVGVMDVLLGGESASICPHGDASLSVSDILVKCS